MKTRTAKRNPWQRALAQVVCYFLGHEAMVVLGRHIWCSRCGRKMENLRK